MSRLRQAMSTELKELCDGSVGPAHRAFDPSANRDVATHALTLETAWSAGQCSGLRTRFQYGGRR